MFNPRADSTLRETFKKEKKNSCSCWWGNKRRGILKMSGPAEEKGKSKKEKSHQGTRKLLTAENRIK